MIADKNGNEEFLSDNIWQLFVQQVQSTKSVILGSNAYKGLLEWPSKYMNALSNIGKIVLSNQKSLSNLGAWQLANSPTEALEILSNSGITTVTIGGGSKMASAFLKDQLINEIIYVIEPVIKSEGIPSFSPADIEQKLELISHENIGGLVKLRYNLI